MAGRKQRATNAQIEEALRNSGAVYSLAANQLGCARSTISMAVKRSPVLAKAVEEIIEATLDLAETKLMQNIMAGKEASVFFYLKCKGKSRGYIERTETAIVGQIPVVITETESRL